MKPVYKQRQAKLGMNFVRKSVLHTSTKYSERSDKQCRPRSDDAECITWSGSTLFVIHPGILDTSSSSKMDLFILGQVWWEVKVLENLE